MRLRAHNSSGDQLVDDFFLQAGTMPTAIDAERWRQFGANVQMVARPDGRSALATERQPEMCALLTTTGEPSPAVLAEVQSILERAHLSSVFAAGVVVVDCPDGSRHSYWPVMRDGLA